jgi:hypothetical protein
MEEISDKESYNNSMSKSVLDKMFFLDKVPDNIAILDWGCADGTLLKEVMRFFPENEYLGYDIDEDMCKKAMDNIDEEVFIGWDINNIFRIIADEYPDKKVVVNLSSVIHEVYSYRNTEEIDAFWEDVFQLADIVVIRDMVFRQSMDRNACPNDVRKIRSNADRRYLQDFESIEGSITNNKNLIHYLMKYRYKDNWEREVRENYFPLSRERLDRIIPSNFKIRYDSMFALPYTQRRVEEDFGVEIKDDTHLKLILEKDG